MIRKIRKSLFNNVTKRDFKKILNYKNGVTSKKLFEKASVENVSNEEKKCKILKALAKDNQTTIFK